MTKIQWTEKTLNPIIGCSKISAGCKNCYAEKMAARLQAMGVHGYEKAVDGQKKWTGKLSFNPDVLLQPQKRKKPTMYFVGSMTDVFHEKVEMEWLVAIWEMMASTPQHTYQILTKRAERMNRAVKSLSNRFGVLSNVWLGVSVENQSTANERIPLLLDTPAAIRFISAEPLLGSVNLEMWMPDVDNDLMLDFEDDYGKDIDTIVEICNKEHVFCTRKIAFLTWRAYCESMAAGWMSLRGDLAQRVKTRQFIDWVIVGGESGAHARPMHPLWVENILKDCAEAETPFFFKQWGEWLPNDQRWECHSDTADYNRPSKLVRKNSLDKYPICMVRVGKKAAGNKLFDKIWKELPI